MRRASAALSLLLLVPAALGAQGSRGPTFWGFVALGPGSAADSGFYASGIGGAAQVEHLLFMTRIASLDTKQTKRISDLGLLAGVATRPGRFHVGAAAGLGIVTDSRDSTSLGIPLEAHASVLVTRWTALGVRAFGSLNRLANFGGLTVVLQVGRLRRP
jgi:hypothetical protein